MLDFECSGVHRANLVLVYFSLVGTRSVVSTGHCIDTDGNGTLVDLKKPGTDVRVVFTSNGSQNAVVTASAVSMNANDAGFANCPASVDSFCVNDDVSVITLSHNAPASARVYPVATNPVTSGTQIIVAGYGTSGAGVNGYTISPTFTTKRSGANHVDLFGADDEQGVEGGASEVHYADFDGGGDSGGPAFVMADGQLRLVANNTFSGTFDDARVEGTSGTCFDGIVLSSYADYLYPATGGDITLCLSLAASR